MQDQEVETNIGLVKEAKAIFGHTAAKELWLNLANVYSSTDHLASMKCTALLEAIKLAARAPDREYAFTYGELLDKVKRATGEPEEEVGPTTYCSLFGLLRGGFLASNTMTDEGLGVINSETVFWAGPLLDAITEP